LSLAALKTRVGREVVKNSQSTPKRVVFDPSQTPLVQAITKPSTSQHHAIPLRGAQMGLGQKPGLYK
jgi:hypothetical protein